MKKLIIKKNIYTGFGDLGKSFIRGTNLSKSNRIFDCLGTVDELNSFVGISIYYGKQNKEEFQNEINFLIGIQKTLFEFGALFSTDKTLKFDNHLIKLENEIDKYSGKFSNSFVLPHSDSIFAAYCGVCRTVCRRAERKITSVDGFENYMGYFNRLSYYFYVLGRYVNQVEGFKEIEV